MGRAPSPTIQSHSKFSIGKIMIDFSSFIRNLLFSERRGAHLSLEMMTFSVQLHCVPLVMHQVVSSKFKA